jgi:hypothetical protein
MTNQCPNGQMTKWKPGILPPLVKSVIRASTFAILSVAPELKLRKVSGTKGIPL